jgi:hypothetical protein
MQVDQSRNAEWADMSEHASASGHHAGPALPRRAWEATRSLWERLRFMWHRPLDFSGAWLSFGDAPELFEALVRMRRRTGGPLIHRVLLDKDFHIGIHQQRRLGLPIGAVNCLTVGLPLLLCVDRKRFLALLAQQYGRLQAGEEKRLLPWARPLVIEQPGEPLSEKKIVQAQRQDYRADRLARKLLGRQVAAAALAEFAVRSDWMARRFWPEHWRSAALSATPSAPFSALRLLAEVPPPDEFARESFRHALLGGSDNSEGRAPLGERLDKLRVPRELPTWSSRPALSMLGRQSSKWIARFDRDWCRANAAEWKLHHAYLGRVRAHARTMTQSNRQPTVEDIIELAQLARRLDAQADVRPVYEHALAMAPRHPLALRGLIDCLPPAERDLRLHHARQLFEVSETHRWWACSRAVAELQKPSARGSVDEGELAVWSERLAQADEVEALVRSKLVAAPWHDAIVRDDLSEFERGEMQARLAHSSGVARAWLVRKVLPGLEYRRCYLLLLDIRGLSADKCAFSCHALQRSLELPGPVAVLPAGRAHPLREMAEKAFEPIYVRNAG